MIDVVTGQDVRRLAGRESEQCVSIYLPTHPAGPDAAQDRLRLKNLANRARSELAGLGLRSPEVAELVGPVERLADDADFLAHLEHGLAVFVADGDVERYRLPGPVEEVVMVSDRFLVSPLVAFVDDGVGFAVLALSENHVRLLRGTPHDVVDISDSRLPGSLAEALRFDDRESQLHSHGAGRVGSGQVKAGFHGQGVAGALDEVDRGRFLRAVDAGLHQILGDSSEPLVLAGTEEIVAQFRNLSHHRHVVDGSIGGSPDHLKAEELQRRALPLVPSTLVSQRREAAEMVRAGSTAAIESIDEALVAAASGRVARLFVPIGVHHWGVFDAATGRADEHPEREPGDHDLLNLAAIETLRHGGDVAPVDPSEMPTEGPIAAVLRF